MVCQNFNDSTIFIAEVETKAADYITSNADYMAALLYEEYRISLGWFLNTTHLFTQYDDSMSVFAQSLMQTTLNIYQYY